MVSMSMIGFHHAESVIEAPGSQTRLVELMGRVNDLENTVSDLERQLSSASEASDKCEGSLHAAARKLGVAESNLAAAEAAAAASGSKEKEDADSSMDKEIAEEQAWAAAVSSSSSGAGGGGKNAKWSKLGSHWQTAELEPMVFSKVFDIG